MVALQEISTDMFPEIYETFLRNDDPVLQEDDWKNLFIYPRRGEEDPSGYALVDANRIVGILGTVFSRRVVAGRSARFCNLHSWFVEEEYRGKGLLLMRPVLKLNDTTVTDFTPTDAVCTISKKLGFRELDSTLRILLPCRDRDNSDQVRGVEIVEDRSLIEAELSESDRKIFREHQGSQCRHLLVRSKNDYCYIVCTKVERYWIPYCYIHYLSNKSLFAEESVAIRSQLLGSSKARFAAVDSRAVDGLRLPASFKYPAQSHQLYRSADVEPPRVDSLYSELIMLNLTTFPHLGGTLRGLARKLRVAS